MRGKGSEVRTGVNASATSRTHGPTHELTAIGASSLSFDAEGNLPQDTSRSPMQNYVWDYDNKMRSADIDGNGSADVSFEYDALGRRVARTQVANAVVDFHGLFSLAGIAPSSRWASLVTRRGGAVLFAHRNQQYSVYAYSNSSGAVVERIAYTAYGQPTFMNAAGTVQSTSPNSIRYSYTGREWDASLQLHHFRARWMGPVTGRFLGRDPIGYFASPLIYVTELFLNSVDSRGYFAVSTRVCEAKCNQPYPDERDACRDECQACGKSFGDWLDREGKRKASGELDRILGKLPNCPCTIMGEPQNTGLILVAHLIFRSIGSRLLGSLTDGTMIGE